MRRAATASAAQVVVVFAVGRKRGSLAGHGYDIQRGREERRGEVWRGGGSGGRKAEQILFLTGECFSLVWLLLLLLLLLMVITKLLLVGGRGDVVVRGTVGVLYQFPVIVPSGSFPVGRSARIRRSSSSSHTHARVMRPILPQHFLRGSKLKSLSLALTAISLATVGAAMVTVGKGGSRRHTQLTG